MKEAATRAETVRDSAAKAWLRALQLTAPIKEHPERTLPAVIDELAAKFGDAPALLSDHECLTYRALAERSNQYARWALDQGLGKGDAVGLFMANRPEYLAIWLGITKVGGVVALLNTNLAGPSLAHCIDIVAPKHIICGAGLRSRLTDLGRVWIEPDIEQHSGEILTEDERRPLTINDRALCIYTSGTTGLPKAANVSHGRILQWGNWFAGMMDTHSTDRMYDCLPMYHSVGGVQAPVSVLLSGGSVVICDKFSASQFWTDIARWDCTLFQYIGELCRYLLHHEASPGETLHRIRLACGNGLSPDVWRSFQDRFRIPKIFEFYAATEGAVSLFNVEGEIGAIRRVPSFLGHRAPAVLVRFDIDADEPIRDEQGFCIRCLPNEVGEAIGPFVSGASDVSTRFEGYINTEDSEGRIIRNVFRQGDAWFRTGDLMRKDERGFFYFVARIGDTFRWKGENVAASEVSQAICEQPGVKQAIVYGVAIPNADGRAGMAALVLEGQLDLSAFRADLIKRLPGYACPLFLRIQKELELTGTFKYTKTGLASQGYDPSQTSDIIYFNHPERQAFIPLDRMLCEQIESGVIRI